MLLLWIHFVWCFRDALVCPKDVFMCFLVWNTTNNTHNCLTATSCCVSDSGILWHRFELFSTLYYIYIQVINVSCWLSVMYATNLVRVCPLSCSSRWRMWCDVYTPAQFGRTHRPSYGICISQLMLLHNLVTKYNKF